MKCQACSYPLWGVTSEQCPECGKPFDKLGMWFEPGTVRFACPYCGHKHEGINGQGLPFDAGWCAGCGQALAVKQMAFEPVDPAAPPSPVEDHQLLDVANHRRNQSFQGAGVLMIVLMALIAAVALIGLLWALLYGL